MNKRCFFIFFIVIMTTFGAWAQSTFSGGSGTLEDPLQISNQSDLEMLANDVNKGNSYSGKYLKLTQDIRLSDGTNWQPIGIAGCPFSGIFDGNGHKITNLFIYYPDKKGIGLFGNTDGKGSAIQNIGVEISDGGVTGLDYVGGLAGHNGCAINNCYITGNVAGNTNVGGLAGSNNSCISNSCSMANIKGDRYVGGLAGNNFFKISNCYATGNVEGKERVGGIVGNCVIGDICNSYYNSANSKGIGFTRSEFEGTAPDDSAAIPVSLAEMLAKGLQSMKNLTKANGESQWNDGIGNAKAHYLPAPKPFKNVNNGNIAPMLQNERKIEAVLIQPESEKKLKHGASKIETALEKALKKMNTSLKIPPFLIASQNEDNMYVTPVADKDSLPTIAQIYHFEPSYGATAFMVNFGSVHSNRINVIFYQIA